MSTGGPDEADARSAEDVSSAASRIHSDAADDPRPRPARPWVRRVAIGLSIGALAAALVPVLVVAPYVRDDLRLDRVVRVVALDWRDFGEEKARTRLEYELDRQGVGLAVGDDDCALVVVEEVRRVRCAWGVVIAIPGTDLTVPLSFGSVADLAPDGSLR